MSAVATAASPREMWRGLWPGRAVEAVPIIHVTNGVHLPSWVGPPMRRVLDRHFGEAWWRRASAVATWEALDAVPDAELWDARCEQRAELVEFVQERSEMIVSPSTSRARGSRRLPARLTRTC